MTEPMNPELLIKVAAGLSKHGIDINHVVELAKYFSDENVIKALENDSFEQLNPELLEKLLPVLDDDGKQKIFEKILDGEIDWHFLKKLAPYAKYMHSQIEASVVLGALEPEVLKYLEDIDWQM